MNTKCRTTVLLAAFASAFACASTYAAGNERATRAAVVAEYTQARAQHQLVPSGEVGYDAFAPERTASQLSRAAVESATLQAIREKSLPITREGADDGLIASAPSTTTRDAVKAEAAYALHHGQIVSGEG